MSKYDCPACNFKTNDPDEFLKHLEDCEDVDGYTYDEWKRKIELAKKKQQ